MAFSASPATFLPVLHLGRLLVVGAWPLVAQSALSMLLAAWGNGQGKCVEAAHGGAEPLLS